MARAFRRQVDRERVDRERVDREKEDRVQAVASVVLVDPMAQVVVRRAVPEVLSAQGRVDQVVVAPAGRGLVPRLIGST